MLQRSIVSKGDVGLFDCQFQRGPFFSCKERRCEALWLTIPQKCGSVRTRDVKGGMPQDASWRLGGGEVCQRLKHDRAIPKTTAV